MATQVPPLRGAAFAFDINLVSQADTDVFKTTVTLAAGDIQVSKDGGQYVNLSTFPPAERDLASGADSGTLRVQLTDAEMTADTVAVLFRDQVGAEWQDALVVIHTVTANQIDDLATAAALRFPRNRVYIDPASGIAGTTYPNGESAYPVNDWADAAAIALANNVEMIEIHGSPATISSTADVVAVLVDGGVGTLTLVLGAAVTAKVRGIRNNIDLVMGAGSTAYLYGEAGTTVTYTFGGAGETVYLYGQLRYDANGLPIVTYDYTQTADIAVIDGNVDLTLVNLGGMDLKLDDILLDTGTDGVVVAAGSKAGYALSTAGVDAILDDPVEGAYTLRQVLRLMAAALAGKASGGNTTTITFRDLNDGTDRIVATVDSDGNRTAVTLDAT
jgi:hypothetical protein